MMTTVPPVSPEGARSIPSAPEQDTYPWGEPMPQYAVLGIGQQWAFNCEMQACSDAKNAA